MDARFYSLEMLCRRASWPVCAEMVDQLLSDLANEENQ